MRNRVNYVWMILLVLILLGCRNDPSAINSDEMVAVSANSSHPVNSNEPNINSPLRFIDFSLDIEYPNDQSFEVEYEKKSIGIEVKFEDERTYEKKIGKDALVKIHPLLKKLKFNKSTPDADVKKEILSIFNVEGSYRKIELEVKFSDEIEKEFHFYP